MIIKIINFLALMNLPLLPIRGLRSFMCSELMNLELTFKLMDLY